MMLHLDSMEHDLANKGVWVTTRFLLLTSELCVVAFGSAFGVREDRVSVSGRWSTFSIASISSVTRSAFKGSRWFVRQSPSWSALSRLTLKSFSHFTGSRFIAFFTALLLRENHNFPSNGFQNKTSFLFETRQPRTHVRVLR